MQKLRRFEDDFIFYLPLNTVRVILGYSSKAPKNGFKFVCDSDVYVVCSVDVSTKAVICKHA